MVRYTINPIVVCDGFKMVPIEKQTTSQIAKMERQLQLWNRPLILS